MIWQLELEGTEAEVFAAAEALGFLDEMEPLSISVFETENAMRMEAGFESEADAERIAATLPGATTRQLPPTDWVAEVQRDLAPVQAGRFVLHGSHDREAFAQTEEGIVPIEVEAGPAFGSGHHPTTRGCLEMFSQLLDDGLSPSRVLDLGCGTGVLGIAAALTTSAHVSASDIDPDAVEVTQETAARNGARLTAFVSDGSELPADFDLVFANILAGPLKTLAPHIEKATARGGLLILSGLLDEQADGVLAAYSAFTEQRRLSLEGWTTLLLKRA